MIPKTEIKRSTANFELDGRLKGSTMLRMLISEMGDDPDLIPLKKLEQLAIQLSLVAKRDKPWGAKYLRNVCHGTQPASAALLDAVMRMGMMEDGAPQAMALGHNVTVLAVGKVAVGSILLADSRVCPVCGINFIPRSWNQKFYPAECAKKLWKMNHKGHKGHEGNKK